LGRWQQRERDLALDRQTRDGAFPVIPVLLPGAEPALDFLGLNTWIDLRQRLDDPIRLEIHAKAVHGEAPGPDLLHSVAQTLAEICPYRGLRWFREEDARFFCGREAFIERLSSTVESRHLIAVVGALGSGKSSLVRAGLLPRLRHHQEGQPVYEIATMVPGERPLLRLAAALVPLLGPGMDEIQQRGKSAEAARPYRCGLLSGLQPRRHAHRYLSVLHGAALGRPAAAGGCRPCRAIRIVLDHDSCNLTRVNDARRL
jgi:hypothetical protein